MWNNKLKTLNDFPCLSTKDLWYLGPLGAQFPQIALMAEIP